jgi:hypothetical protein
MRSGNFERALNAFIRRRPFKPFRVTLDNGDRFTVDHPEALALRGAVAVFIDPQGNYMLFDNTSVSQLTEGGGNGRGRRREA